MLKRFAILAVVAMMLCAGQANAEKIFNQGMPMTIRSGSITTGGTAQQLMAANSNRQGFIVQNLSSSQNLYLNITCGTAAADNTSMLLLPYGSYESTERNTPLCAISILGPTTSQQFYAAEF